ncbi:hypothetical protein [uncultured Sulfitobacter sp.]|nr:hypothetical protein [uncultured Sulfitobacter sp.]
MRSLTTSSQLLRALVAALTLSQLSACKFPDDPEGTTQEVTGGVLEVAVC